MNKSRGTPKAIINCGYWSGIKHWKKSKEKNADILGTRAERGKKRKKRRNIWTPQTWSCRKKENEDFFVVVVFVYDTLPGEKDEKGLC